MESKCEAIGQISIHTYDRSCAGSPVLGVEKHSIFAVPSACSRLICDADRKDVYFAVDGYSIRSTMSRMSEQRFCALHQGVGLPCKQRGI